MSDLIIFTNNFPFGDGETFLETEVNYLSHSFDTVHFFPLFYGKSRLARVLPANITFSEPFIKIDSLKKKGQLSLYGLFNLSPFFPLLNEFFIKKVFLKKEYLKSWGAEFCIARILLKSRKKIISEVNPNTIIYFYWGDKSSGVIPILRKKLLNPIIVRFHNSDLYEEIKAGYIPFRKKLLENLTTAVFISAKGEQYLINQYPNINFDHKLFRLGVNNSGISQPSNDNVLRIVSCSYVVPIKRLNLIANALNCLDIKIEWTHLGGGSLLDELKKSNKILRSNIKTVFLGQVNNKEVIQFYLNNRVDLFLNVSESEGIPVSIMEAISMGIPVIATDVGGTSEIVNNTFGRLIPKNFKIELLAQEIKAFSEKSPLEKEKMRNNAKAFWVKNYNSETNYKQFADFLAGTNF
jgi:glycosyltransferase involved in cell wall biosynthesis